MLKFSNLPPGLTAGILICLFFTLSFSFAGYTMPLSMFLGILGGIACGLVVTWWNMEEIPEIPVEVDKIESEPEKNLSLKLPVDQIESEPEKKSFFKLPATKLKLDTKSAQSSDHSRVNSRVSGVSLFDWLFKKK